MTKIILASLVSGIALGYYWLSPELLTNCGTISTYALGLLIMSVGIDLGGDRDTWSKLAQKGFKVLLLPILVAIGSISGAVVAGLVLDLPFNEASAVGAGFGWYSLSGVMLSKLHTVEIGTLAFLTNIFREVIAILLMPLLAKHLSFLTAVAPGGATTMDTTLPLIAKTTDGETTVLAFINGATLSALVPLLVPLLIGIKL